MVVESFIGIPYNNNKDKMLFVWTRVHDWKGSSIMIIYRRDYTLGSQWT